MTDHSSITKVEAAQQVLCKVSEGMSVTDACKEVGIPRSTYYAYLEKHPEIIPENKDALILLSRKRLGMFKYSQPEITKKLIDEALSDETSPRGRIALNKELERTSEKLEEEMRIQGVGGYDEAPEMLGELPKLTIQKSKLGPGYTEEESGQFWTERLIFACFAYFGLKHFHGGYRSA